MEINDIDKMANNLIMAEGQLAKNFQFGELLH